MIYRLKCVAAKATTAATCHWNVKCMNYNLNQHQGGDLIQTFYKYIVAVDSILFSFLLHVFINAVF